MVWQAWFGYVGLGQAWIGRVRRGLVGMDERRIKMVFQPKRQYEWSTFNRNVDANVVGGVMEMLEERDGSATKESFLEASRPEDSQTHSLFEWDDKVAAEAYRLKQSGSIINDLRVVYVTPKKEEVKVTAFVNVNSGKEKGSYENITQALADEGKREIILNRLRGELDAFITRNQNIEELADLLIEAAEKVRKKRGVA